MNGPTEPIPPLEPHCPDCNSTDIKGLGPYTECQHCFRIFVP